MRCTSGTRWRLACLNAAWAALALACSPEPREGPGGAPADPALAGSRTGSAYELAGGAPVASQPAAPARAWPALPDSRRPAPIPVPDPELPARGGVFPDIQAPPVLAEHEGRAVRLERADFADGRPERIGY
ncbi:MAG: hypothetical protein RL112_370, partial [Planctomycetota bacterium]